MISDTHGLLRPAAVAALSGADLILHAGDVGSPDVLAALAGVAPVRAVRGNVDIEPWARSLPETDLVDLQGFLVYVIHDLGRLDIEPAGAGVAAVVSGHSHRPVVEQRRGVLYLNPGSAGPRRFSLPISLAWIEVAAGAVRPRLVTLEE